jgi:hypothetical protein
MKPSTRTLTFTLADTVVQRMSELWLYCRVPFHNLDYLMERLHNCAANDMTAEAFELATKILGGHEVIEEYLACIIWLLGDTWDLNEVKPLSN